jgi:hypothetical protein
MPADDSRDVPHCNSAKTLGGVTDGERIICTALRQRTRGLQRRAQ